MAAKETPKTQKAKPRSRVKASAVTQRPTYAELRQQLAELTKELEQCKRQLGEDLEQQTATSEILGVIAASPTNLQRVLDTIAKSAAQVCSADDAGIRLVQHDGLRLAAHHGSIPLETPLLAISRDSAVGRAVVDRDVVHIQDLLAVAAEEFPERFDITTRLGIRTILIAPLMRENEPIGVIVIRRTVVRPFSDKQIKLLKTFASQAVIAIENARLFKELQERNAELREALEHQTATSEVLGIISRSPTDVQPVLDAIVESVAKVCGIDDVVLRLREGDTMVARAHFGPIPIRRVEISIDDTRVSLDARAWHASRSRRPRARTISQRTGSTSGLRTILARSPSSAGGTHWIIERSSHRGAPLHPGADQAARNLRRSGRDRYRERPVVPGTQRIVGTTDRDERNLGCHRQLADGDTAGAGCGCGERGHAVRCN